MASKIQKRHRGGIWHDDNASMRNARVLSAALDRDLDKTMQLLVEEANILAGEERYRVVEG